MASQNRPTFGRVGKKFLIGFGVDGNVLKILEVLLGESDGGWCDVIALFGLHSSSRGTYADAIYGRLFSLSTVDDMACPIARQ